LSIAFNSIAQILLLKQVRRDAYMKFEVEMEYEKATKRTFRFLENNPNYKIGTLYVQKTALGDKAPKRIKVTVETIE
jgi:hypothetical protein